MQVITKNTQETIELGRRIAKTLIPSSIVALFGDLGSGKTVLVKGIAEALGGKAENVLSPSFVLMREYKTKIPLYHFDLYRIEKTDVLHLGFEEYFYGNGISVVEWADRIKDDLPKDCLRVNFYIKGDNKRVIKINQRIDI
ncbi:MAG TPA: tRNA (adenosine(37)-N6)-threonylcarbamoyltransferase complex ATPase subunit type 1 TsaE [Candidatus Omnitrophica bacterium]|nr:tRNA (adenosine(37)-N6)-threonylcarbamoyltransferase complex ATPase subunit type 1 TsaE [Candidatus Omnitrophota bacterium]